MADAILYATATYLEATLVTCDNRFASLPGGALL
jgi:predicted nucleic acid-binding protein